MLETVELGDWLDLLTELISIDGDGNDDGDIVFEWIFLLTEINDFKETFDYQCRWRRWQWWRYR